MIVRELDDGILVLDMARGRIHQLNATAGLIWGKCDGVAGAADIAAYLAGEYDVEEGIVAKDVATTLSKLQALNLVTEA